MANFIFAIRRFLWQKNSVIKIHADFCRWSWSFLPSFCTFLHYSCCNSNVLPQFEVLQYNSLNVQSWPKFQSENSFTRNEKILNSTMVDDCDFQDTEVLTSILWRHSYMKISDRSQTSFWRPFTPNSLFACILYCHERVGWGRQNWLCPRAWETLGTPLHKTTYCTREIS